MFSLKIDEEMFSPVGITNYLRGKQKLLSSAGQTQGSLLQVAKNIKLKLIWVATCPTQSQHLQEYTNIIRWSLII